jgi:hypothetical protein
LKKVEKEGRGGGSPLVTTRKLRTLSLQTSTTKLKALSFKRIERGKKKGWIAIINNKRVQNSKLKKQ